MPILQKIKSIFKLAARNTAPPIHVKNDGFSTKASVSSSEIVIKWLDVFRVTTYKVDLFTVDCICLLFETESQKVEVNEEQEGFSELMTILGSNFPIDEEWYLKVMQPPFATNKTVLFNRKKHEHT